MSTIVEQVQGQLLQQLPYIMSVINSGKAQVQQRSKLLKTLAGLVLVYGLNKTLSAIARNHWRLRKQGVAWVSANLEAMCFDLSRKIMSETCLLCQESKRFAC